jgi:hypothetical protein
LSACDTALGIQSVLLWAQELAPPKTLMTSEATERKK